MARTRKSIELDAAPLTVYERLSRFEDYPSFVQDLRHVRRIDATHLQWQFDGEDARVWETRLTHQIPARRLVWRGVAGTQLEASLELEPSDGARARTRLTLAIEIDERQMGLPHGDEARTRLEQRVQQDLERFKKHIEQYEPGGVQAARAAVLAPESTPGISRTDAEMIGKTVAQTVAEREESAHSLAGSRRRAESDPWQSMRDVMRESARDSIRESTWSATPSAAARSARRLTPSMTDLWNLWQRPLHLARRMSHQVERAIDTMATAIPSRRAEGVMPVASESPTVRDSVAGSTTWSPTVETAQRTQHFVVCAEVPGVKREDIQVEIKHDRVTIEGDRHPEPQHEVQEERRSERHYGHFCRTILLPPGAEPDGASAALHDGLLEVTVPLTTRARPARRLDVRQV